MYAFLQNHCLEAFEHLGTIYSSPYVVEIIEYEESSGKPMKIFHCWHNNWCGQTKGGKGDMFKRHSEWKESPYLGKR